MGNLNIVLFLLADTLIVLAVERIMRVFFEKRKTPCIVTILSYFFLWSALSAHTWWLEYTTLTTFVYLLALMFISLNYESTKIKRLSAIAGSYFIMISGTSIFQFLLYAFTSVELVDIGNFIYMLAMVLVYLLSLLAFKVFKNIKSTTINLDKLWLPFIFFPTAQAISTIFFDLNLSFFIQVTIVGSNVGITFILFYLYNNLSKSFEENLKSALHAQEKEYYLTQCQLMQDSVERVKSIRHDIKIHLATIQDFATNGNTEEIKVYLDSLVDGIESGEVYSDTGNIAFDSIINYKLRNAKNENIKLDLSVAVPPELDVEVVDIVTILGNLLDNALEAVAKASEKFIKLDIEFIKGGLFAKVENSFNGEIRYSKEKQVTSLKAGNEHGYGLKNIRQSVEKYGGHMEITHTENTFSTGVFLFIGDKASI